MRSFSSPSSEATSVARTMALRDGSPCGAAPAACPPWARATSWRNPARRRNAAPPAYWTKPDAPNTMRYGGKDEEPERGGLGAEPSALLPLSLPRHFRQPVMEMNRPGQGEGGGGVRSAGKGPSAQSDPFSARVQLRRVRQRPRAGPTRGRRRPHRRARAPGLQRSGELAHRPPPERAGVQQHLDRGQAVPHDEAHVQCQWRGLGGPPAPGTPLSIGSQYDTFGNLPRTTASDAFHHFLAACTSYEPQGIFPY